MGTIEKKAVGVIGAGSFGSAISNLLAMNTEVLMYARDPEKVSEINTRHENMGISLDAKIQATSDLEEVARICRLIFPIVPSSGFRKVMQMLGPFLRPEHILIHGTKGFDLSPDVQLEEGGILKPKKVHTMSQVIQQESCVLRVGCLSGPNLAREIIDGQPTATVIGSHFDEVIREGKKVLSSGHFHVFGTYDLLGAELAGGLKNIIAIGSGILRGHGFGKNLQAMLITRGLTEMVHIGKTIGADASAFFGTAGIGDLVATATSRDSRNFTFGYRLGQGETREEILASSEEVAEGLRTLQITYQLSKYYKLRLPITEMLHRVVFEAYDVEKALNYLITYPYDVDVDFL
jgi:glycerol-3-phosphate dehydrogenase (NAD(P)+)